MNSMIESSRRPANAWHVVAFALFVVTGVALVGCESGGQAGGSSNLTFAECRLKQVDTLARCALVTVPEDHSNPGNGKTIRVHVAVLPSLSRRAEPDPVYLLAGGPGQAASDLGRLAGALGDLRKHRDLILVDQRGTGKSKTLTCDAGGESTKLDPLLQTLTASDTEMEADRARCLATLKGNAANHRTDDYIDDLEFIRKAMGQSKINVWGGSYGSRVALRYMKRFPGILRSAVLDGVAPTTLRLPDDALASSDAELRSLLAACASSTGCNKAYPDALGSFDRLLGALKTQPARVRVNHPATGAPIDATITDRTVVSLLWPLLYQPEAARMVPALIAQALQGSYAPLAATASGSATNADELSTALRVAVMCAEDMLGRSATVNPRFESVSTLFYRACKDFPHGSVAPEYFEATRSDVPTLLLSGSHDPVTPPSQAELAAKTLAQHKHITVAGMGHIVSPHPCVRRIVGKFIEAGTIASASAPCEAELKLPRPLFYVSALEAQP